MTARKHRATVLHEVHPTSELLVWAVFVERTNALLTVTLTSQRLLADGTTLKFDEDPACPLDRTAGADDALVRDGFLALPPPMGRR